MLLFIYISIRCANVTIKPVLFNKSRQKLLNGLQKKEPLYKDAEEEIMEIVMYSYAMRPEKKAKGGDELDTLF